jgi:GNAT superfamily N-acetyltransferase
MLGKMGEELRIEPIGEDEFEALLPMIADYQRFYEAEDIDPGRNRGFFRRFLEPSDEGLIIGAWRDGALAGYACLYWHHSSTRAVDTVLLNDLFVAEGFRNAGVGRALIEATREVARERGADLVEWSTRPDNHTAQRLYDSVGASRSTWIEYELPA